MNYLSSADSATALLHDSNVTLLTVICATRHGFPAKWNVSEIIWIHFAYSFSKELIESGGETWKVICPSHSTEPIRFVADRLAQGFLIGRRDTGCTSRHRG